MSQTQGNGNGRWLKMSLLVLVALNLLLMASIWLPRLKRSPGRERGIGGREHDLALQFLEETLQLTPEQRQKTASLRANHFAKTEVLRQEINFLRRQIMDEVLAGSPDKAKVERLATELGGKQGGLEKLTFYHFLNLYSLCQPAQKDKFRSLMGELLDRLKPSPPDPERRPRAQGRREPFAAEPQQRLGESERRQGAPAADEPGSGKPGRQKPPPPAGARDEVSRIQNQVERLRDRLGLSDEQVQKLVPLIEPFARQIDELRGRTSADPQALRQAEKDLKDRRDEAIASILTAEQRARFDELKRERPEQGPPR
jgi:Spy/CpxP family protein refolding chaperone